MSVSRNVGIAMAFSAMKKLGVGVVVDFTVKSLAPDALIEHVCQAACLADVDKWVLRLPIAEIHEDSPKILDELTVIRIPPIPILDGKDQGEPEPLSEHFEEEEDVGVDAAPLLYVLEGVEQYRRNYVMDIEGWGI